MIIDMKDISKLLNLKQACKMLFLIRSLVDNKENGLAPIPFLYK